MSNRKDDKIICDHCGNTGTEEEYDWRDVELMARVVTGPETHMDAPKIKFGPYCSIECANVGNKKALEAGKERAEELGCPFEEVHHNSAVAEEIRESYDKSSRAEGKWLELILTMIAGHITGETDYRPLAEAMVESKEPVIRCREILIKTMDASQFIPSDEDVVNSVNYVLDVLTYTDSADTVLTAIKNEQKHIDRIFEVLAGQVEEDIEEDRVRMKISELIKRKAPGFGVMEDDSTGDLYMCAKDRDGSVCVCDMSAEAMFDMIDLLGRLIEKKGFEREI